METYNEGYYNDSTKIIYSRKICLRKCFADLTWLC